MKRPRRMALGARAALIAIALLVVGVETVAAVSIYLAPFVLLHPSSETPRDALESERRLLERLRSTPLTGSVDFALVPRRAAAPSSFLEAARLCETEGCAYLIYGYVERKDSRYSSELKLLAREGKRIVATFFAIDDDAHYARLLADLTSKIADYFLKDLAILPGHAPSPSTRVRFELPLYLGYWGPVGEWSSGATGLFRAGFGFRFIPRYPTAALLSRPLCLSIGLGIEYALGMGRPGFEASLLHRAIVRAPLECSLELDARSRVGAALGALVELDVLAQERKYGERLVETTTAGGASVSLSYRYAFSDRLALGLDCAIDAVFYSRPLYAVSPGICLLYSLDGKTQTSGGAR